MPDAKKYYMNYRPATYWSCNEALFANIKGEFRRREIKRAMILGSADSLPPAIFADSLSEEVRDAVGKLRPAYMSGEYLPDAEENEVEIARVGLDSTTYDITSLRAIREDDRIRYRWVDEYGDLTYRIARDTSKRPLTFRELVSLINKTKVVEIGVTGLPRAFLSQAEITPEELLSFVDVSSEFYPQLRQWYSESAAEYVEERRRVGDYRFREEEGSGEEA